METPGGSLTRVTAKATPYIHNLPPELLQHVLSLTIAEIRDGHRPWHVYRRIAKLRLVSIRWTTVIDSHPSFWTVLTNRFGPSLVSRVLEKSGTLPLYVDVTASFDTAPLRYMNTVTQLADRWRSLNVYWFADRDGEEALENLLLTPAPQLKEFFFEGFAPLGIFNLFDNVAPNLDTISTHLVQPSWTSFVMSGLRKLAIQGVEAELSDLENVIRVLTASPNMEELRLVSWAPMVLQEELPIVLGPVDSDSLRSLTLRILPPSWIIALLDAIRIPQHCTMDIAVDMGSALAPLREVLKHLLARLSRSSSLRVTLQDSQGVMFECGDNDEVGKTSILLHLHTAWDIRPLEVLQFWQNSLTEIAESTQALGIPIHLTIFADILHHPDSPEHPLTSGLQIVDELLPSVYKASIAGTNLQEFLKYASSPSFFNLSDLEVLDTEKVPWEDMLECLSARSRLAAVPGSTLKALRSISLPRHFFHEEAFGKLSNFVGKMYWT